MQPEIVPLFGEDLMRSPISRSKSAGGRRGGDFGHLVEPNRTTAIRMLTTSTPRE